MKRIGLFLLAVVMVAGLAGCGDASTASSSTSSGDTVAIIGFNDSCIGEFNTATGRVNSVNTTWISGEFSIQPGQNIRIVLPSGGPHRIYISYGDWYWDYTYDFPEGVETTRRFSCS